MKKVGLFLIAALFVIGFTACQKAESGDDASAKTENAADVGANGTTEGTGALSTTDQPQTPAKPDYQVKAEEMAKTSAKFDTEEFDWGKVAQGDVVTHQFTFTNTGSEDLVLTRVKASCGCTTPSWSKEPVKPGENGFIDVEFKSAGKKGMQNKTITVTGNFEGQINKILRIKGEVEAEG